MILIRTHRWVARPPHGPKLTAILSLSMFWTLMMMTASVWIWALAFWELEVFKTFESSVYFALVVFTTLGFGDLLLPVEWRLLGGLAAANGLLIFGIANGDAGRDAQGDPPAPARPGGPGPLAAVSVRAMPAPGPPGRGPVPAPRVVIGRWPAYIAPTRSGHYLPLGRTTDCRRSSHAATALGNIDRLSHRVEGLPASDRGAQGRRCAGLGRAPRAGAGGSAPAGPGGDRAGRARLPRSCPDRVPFRPARPRGQATAVQRQDRLCGHLCQDRVGRLAAAWMLGCVDGGRIVGLAELYEIDGGTECSVSVLRSWQGRGIATALLGAAIDRVCRDQRRDLVLLAQSDNLRLTRLALHLGATATRVGRDVTLVFRPPEAPGGR